MIDCGYRMNLLVNDTVVVELKAVDHILSLFCGTESDGGSYDFLISLRCASVSLW